MTSIPPLACKSNRQSGGRKRYFIPNFVQGKNPSTSHKRGSRKTFEKFVRSYGYVGDIVVDVQYAMKWHSRLSGILNKHKLLFQENVFRGYLHCMRKALKRQDFGNPSEFLDFLNGKVSCLSRYSPWLRLSDRVQPISPYIEDWIPDDLKVADVQHISNSSGDRGVIVTRADALDNYRTTTVWVPDPRNVTRAPFQEERPAVPLVPFNGTSTEARRAAETLCCREGDRRRKFLQAVDVYKDPLKGMYRSILDMEYPLKRDLCRFLARKGIHALYPEHVDQDVSDIEMNVFEGTRDPPEGWSDDEVITRVLLGNRPEGMIFPRR